MSTQQQEVITAEQAEIPAGPLLEWHRVLATRDLPEGRVITVAAGHKSVALVHFDGQFSALDNHCPHQGGPLGDAR